ncbi:MAG: 7-carboxy-7-deazaguanine synthase QueE [Thermodesulfobacteriota bacterium]
MKVNEIFYSIQGEGLKIGQPTVFLRLFACDLRCSWCDTMYAVEGSDFREISNKEIISAVGKYGCRQICITGGEPLIQKKELVPLTKELIKKGYFIVLETSGHKEPPEIFENSSCLISMDCKCPSSGMENRMHFDLFEKLGPKDQLKFVIGDEEDYLYAKSVLNKHELRASVIFQPVYGKNLTWLTESVLKDNLNSVRVTPQLHKIVWGEKRGV